MSVPSNQVTHHSTACFSRRSKGTIWRVSSWVAESITGQATPSSAASFHVWAQTHHLSPGERPGNPCSDIGVIRSLPWERANSRNPLETMQQTVCKPRSLRSVLQQPSLYHPVRGSAEQVCNSPPRTLNEGSNEANSGIWLINPWMRSFAGACPQSPTDSFKGRTGCEARPGETGGRGPPGTGFCCYFPAQALLPQTELSLAPVS